MGRIIFPFCPFCLFVLALLGLINCHRHFRVNFVNFYRKATRILNDLLIEISIQFYFFKDGWPFSQHYFKKSIPTDLHFHIYNIINVHAYMHSFLGYMFHFIDFFWGGNIILCLSLLPYNYRCLVKAITHPCSLILGLFWLSYNFYFPHYFVSFYKK